MGSTTTVLPAMSANELINQTKRDLSVRGRCDVDKERGITRPATASVPATGVLGHGTDRPVGRDEVGRRDGRSSIASLKLTLKVIDVSEVTPSVDVRVVRRYTLNRGNPGSVSIMMS